MKTLQIKHLPVIAISCFCRLQPSETVLREPPTGDGCQLQCLARGHHEIPLSIFDRCLRNVTSNQWDVRKIRISQDAQSQTHTHTQTHLPIPSCFPPEKHGTTITRNDDTTSFNCITAVKRNARPSKHVTVSAVMAVGNICAEYTTSMMAILVAAYWHNTPALHTLSTLHVHV